MASASSAASPSKIMAPISAPRSGPDARPNSIGGPAWQNSPGRSPSASPAGRTSTSVARTASIRRAASAFAADRRGSASTVRSAAGTAAASRVSKVGRTVVDGDDVHRLGAQGVGEQVDTGADHLAWTGQEIGRSSSRDSPRSSSGHAGDPSHRRLHRRSAAPVSCAAREARSGPGGRGVRGEHPRAGRGQRRGLGLPVLRVAGRPAQRDHHRQRASVACGRGDRGRNRRREPPAGSGSAARPSTTSSSTTATSGSAACCASNSSRSVGSIIGCGRPTVNASSPRSTIAWPSPVSAEGPVVAGRSIRISPRLGPATTRGLGGQGAAGEQPAQGSGRVAGAYRSACRPVATPASCGAGRPSVASTSSAPAVMSG